VSPLSSAIDDDDFSSIDPFFCVFFFFCSATALLQLAQQRLPPGAAAFPPLSLSPFILGENSCFALAHSRVGKRNRFFFSVPVSPPFQRRVKSLSDRE